MGRLVFRAGGSSFAASSASPNPRPFTSKLADLTVGGDDNRQDDGAGVLEEPGDLAVGRLDLMSDTRGSDATRRYSKNRRDCRFGVSHRPNAALPQRNCTSRKLTGAGAIAQEGRRHRFQFKRKSEDGCVCGSSLVCLYRLAVIHLQRAYGFRGLIGLELRAITSPTPRHRVRESPRPHRIREPDSPEASCHHRWRGAGAVERSLLRLPETIGDAIRLGRNLGQQTRGSDENEQPRRAKHVDEHSTAQRKKPVLFRAGFFDLTGRLPSLPHTCACSTIGAEGLNFRVRDGNGWDPLAKVTQNSLLNCEMRNSDKSKVFG